MNSTSRGRAVAKADAAIEQNVATIQAAKAKPTALASMADRLQISQQNLQNTLRNTVFKGAKDEEFAALIIVAESYRLNPLTKEIYAFPAKGGGIVPLVSIDGWIRIMNEHPQFDGIEFEDILDDDGKVYAIESTIWRRDRTRPIKVTEYMDECKRNTEPWNKSPNRMLRHRALIQGARYAFGFSGIYADDEVVMNPDPIEVRDITPMPTRADMIEHDAATGEIIEEGRTDSQHGDQADGAGEVEPYAAVVADLIERANRAATVIDLKAVEKDWQPHMEVLPDHENERINEAVEASRDRLGGKGE